jgi:hypothetical protein
VKTASFSTYTGPGRISIARFAPRGTPGGFRIYKPLAPGEWFKIADIQRYRELYFAQLAKLDPQRVHDELHNLAAGAEPVLLCWEKPPFTPNNFCHRRMVATWFEIELKLEVPEFDPASE